MLINGQVRPLTPKGEQEKEEEWSGLWVLSRVRGMGNKVTSEQK